MERPQYWENDEKWAIYEEWLRNSPKVESQIKFTRNMEIKNHLNSRLGLIDE
jgi:hypothetical protein